MMQVNHTSIIYTLREKNFKILIKKDDTDEGICHVNGF